MNPTPICETMMKEVKLAKRYLGARFGYGEPIPEGTYAVPFSTSSGNAAYMRVQVNTDTTLSGFEMYWDEALTSRWQFGVTKPVEVAPESDFARCFRDLEEAGRKLW